jgi:hypothetical protein
LPGQPAGSAGSLLFLFFHQPGSIPPPGRSGPGSTRRIKPGFKTKPDEMGLAPFYLLHIFFSTFLSSNNISSQEALFWCPLELYYLKELSSSNENDLMRAVEIIDVAYKLGILHSSSHILFPYWKISWERHAVNFICNKVCIEPVYPEIHLWVIYANLA